MAYIYICHIDNFVTFHWLTFPLKTTTPAETATDTELKIPELKIPAPMASCIETILVHLHSRRRLQT